MIREQFGKLYCLREFNKRGQLFVGMDNKALPGSPSKLSLKLFRAFCLREIGTSV